MVTLMRKFFEMCFFTLHLCSLLRPYPFINLRNWSGLEHRSIATPWALNRRPRSAISVARLWLDRPLRTYRVDRDVRQWYAVGDSQRVACGLGQSQGKSLQCHIRYIPIKKKANFYTTDLQLGDYRIYTRESNRSLSSIELPEQNVNLEATSHVLQTIMSLSGFMLEDRPSLWGHETALKPQDLRSPLYASVQ